MTKFLRTLISPPRFPLDEEKTRRAGLFHVCYLFSVGWLGCILIGNVAGGKLSGEFNALILGVVALGHVPYVLARRGRLEFGAAVWLVMAFLAATAALAMLGTIRAPALGFYLVLVLCSGFVFGVRAMAATIVLCSLAVAGLIAAENLGWLPVPIQGVGITQWVTATSFFVAAGGLTLLATQQIRISLHRAERELEERRRSEAELREANRRLEQSVHTEKTLRGLLPICAWCRKVREDEGYWRALESYVVAHTEATFTHGICPDCQAKNFPPHCDRVR